MVSSLRDISEITWTRYGRKKKGKKEKKFEGLFHHVSSNVCKNYINVVVKKKKEKKGEAIGQERPRNKYTMYER